jgi:hypothetical protein
LSESKDFCQNGREAKLRVWKWILMIRPVKYYMVMLFFGMAPIVMLAVLVHNFLEMKAAKRNGHEILAQVIGVEKNENAPTITVIVFDYQGDEVKLSYVSGRGLVPGSLVSGYYQPKTKTVFDYDEYSFYNKVLFFFMVATTGVFIFIIKFPDQATEFMTGDSAV